MQSTLKLPVQQVQQQQRQTRTELKQKSPTSAAPQPIAVDLLRHIGGGRSFAPKHRW